MFIKTSIDMWFKSRLTKCSVFKDINELLELIPQNKFSKRKITKRILAKQINRGLNKIKNKTSFSIRTSFYRI